MGPKGVNRAKGSSIFPFTIFPVNHCVANFAPIIIPMLFSSNAGKLMFFKWGYRCASGCVSGNSASEPYISPTRALSIFNSMVLFRSVTVNEAMVRFAMVSSENVPNLTLVDSTGALICRVSDSLIALQVAPVSSSAYVGTVACPADANTGTIGRMATVPSHAPASQLLAVHSSLCKRWWCGPPHSHWALSQLACR